MKYLNNKLMSITTVALLCTASSSMAHPGHELDPIVAAEQLSNAFEKVATTLSPSVVTIRSTKEVEVRRWNNSMRDMFQNSPFEDFFGPMENQGQTQRQVQEGLGSGVIVSNDGHVLTNSHVIQGADELMVVLSDGREFKATVVGNDSKTDIAVIQIKADNLDVANLGNSDDIRVGQWVIAAGNPFGLSSSITTGIVSAKGRSGVGITDYEDFIQTDAAINRGNSGGALANLRGEVIGINTAMLGYAGNIGIGFAIPINMVKDIMNELIEEGTIIRGYLGVMISELNDAISNSLDYSGTNGVYVSGIFEGGPAELAGIQAGDIITHFNGKEIADMAQLRLDIAEIDPGTNIDLKVFRKGSTIKFAVTIEALPANS